jgi:4-aminobutyrate aminotransferase
LLIHTSVVTRHEPAIQLAERLGTLVPFIDEPRVFFCNSGAEAVDGALKMARKVTGRGGVIAFTGAFHGRTLAATTLTTTKAKYREGYEPLLPMVFHAPYGHVPGALDALDELLVAQRGQIGCMIVEPVLGEGGYVAPPVAWLEGLRERCSRHDIVLVFDEVQSGMGRTGRPFAAETFGVTPDVVLFAKGIASGLPLGGIIAGRRLMDRWPQGAHGSTFGGNPVACAAALATIDALELGHCFERAQLLGAVALTRLVAAGAANPDVVRDVRGVGLMIGVELRDADAAAAVQRQCFDEGLLVLTCGPNDNVLRLIPPLTITDDELEQGLAIITAALALVR